MSESITITGPEDTAYAGLLSMRYAIMLEAKGFKRSRGPSTAATARQMGLVKSRSLVKASAEFDAYVVQYADEHGYPVPRFAQRKG